MSIFHIIIGFALLSAVGCSASQTTHPVAPTQTKTGHSSETNSSASGQQPENEVSRIEENETTPPKQIQSEQQKFKIRVSGAIYTQNQPGAYPELVSSHVPQVSMSGRNLTIAMDHPQEKGKFVKWYQIRTVAGDILTEKEFSEPATKTYVPTKFSPVTVDLSGAELKKDQILYIYASCGEHGIWRSQVTVP